MKPKLIAVGRACAALAFLAALGGCAGLGKPLESPRVTLADLRIREARTLEAALEVVLRVTNPNEAALDIQGLHADLEVNDRPFAHGASPAGAAVPPFGSETLTLVMHSSVIDVFRALVDLPRNEALRYRVQGRLRALVGGVPSMLPFAAEGTLDIRPQRPLGPSP